MTGNLMVGKNPWFGDPGPPLLLSDARRSVKEGERPNGVKPPILEFTRTTHEGGTKILTGV